MEMESLPARRRYQCQRWSSSRHGATGRGGTRVSPGSGLPKPCICICMQTAEEFEVEGREGEGERRLKSGMHPCGPQVGLLQQCGSSRARDGSRTIASARGMIMRGGGAHQTRPRRRRPRRPRGRTTPSTSPLRAETGISQSQSLIPEQIIRVSAAQEGKGRALQVPNSAKTKACLWSPWGPAPGAARGGQAAGACRARPPTGTRPKEGCPILGAAAPGASERVGRARTHRDRAQRTIRVQASIRTTVTDGRSGGASETDSSSREI